MSRQIKTLDAFTAFAQLPTELQDEVWEFSAANEPTVHFRNLAVTQYLIRENDGSPRPTGLTLRDATQALTSQIAQIEEAGWPVLPVANASAILLLEFFGRVFTCLIAHF